MQVLVVLIVLGWLLSLPWTAILLGLLVLLIVLAACCYVALRLPGNIGSPIGNNRTAIDHHYVAALESMVAEAETQVETLRAEVERLRAAAHRKSPNADANNGAALHGRVGLCEHAPEWLVAAARRAYRAKLHPDRHPPSVKAEAERRFKTAESVFDAIAAQRASA